MPPTPTDPPASNRSARAAGAGPASTTPPEEPGLVEAIEHVVDEAAEAIEIALRFPERPPSRWRRMGFSRRGARRFNLVATAVLVLFVVAWGWSLAEASRTREVAGDVEPRPGLSLPTARITAALTDPRASTAAYLTDAALAAMDPGRGLSGRLRAVIRDPGEPLDVEDIPEGADIGFTEEGHAPDTAMAVIHDSVRAPDRPGLWQMVLRAGSLLRPVGDFTVITRRPLSDRRNGRVGLYFIGTWPTERGTHKGYVTPSGFIEVTRENQNTYVSEHFRLRDFLTKGQANVWPKYLVLDMQLVDKLELVLADLEEKGVDVSGVRVMSGFRTPQYNANGGNTAGRASLSRHMYGDASDVYIDNDGDGWMDDINRDGRVDTGDARYLAAAAERVERKHPSLVGGIGIYTAGSGHGPFVHIDTRGYRARW
jgi:uncharacterized protein YcbK (DUF882 family)